MIYLMEMENIIIRVEIYYMKGNIKWVKKWVKQNYITKMGI